MLSRTAENLFWLSRYMERAESVARMLSVGHRMAGLARSLGSPTNEWQSTLIAAGCAPSFTERYESEPCAAKTIAHLVLDLDNPSSIRSCIETARRNARAVRTALTVDLWDTINESWQRTRSLTAADIEGDQLVPFLEWVKQRSLLFSGAYMNTMLRNEAFWFVHLGTALERAEHTARILDVKYHLLLPEYEGVGGVLDYNQWQSILRAVSALRSYHWVYHDRLKPWLIADLLILRPEMPRSLLACTAQAVESLDQIAYYADGRRGECHRLAGQLHAELKYAKIEKVFQAGLHEFLAGFLDHSGQLGGAIATQYLHA